MPIFLFFFSTNKSDEIKKQHFAQLFDEGKGTRVLQLQWL